MAGGQVHGKEVVGIAHAHTGHIVHEQFSVHYVFAFRSVTVLVPIIGCACKLVEQGYHRKQGNVHCKVTQSLVPVRIGLPVQRDKIIGITAAEGYLSRCLPCQASSLGYYRFLWVYSEFSKYYFGAEHPAAGAPFLEHISLISCGVCECPSVESIECVNDQRA